MECPYCKSDNITNLKVGMAPGITKNKSLQCHQSFITRKTDEKSFRTIGKYNISNVCLNRILVNIQFNLRMETCD